MTGSLDAPPEISGQEFAAISTLLYQRTGIRLAAGKETLVMGRLGRRLRQLGVDTYADYVRLLLRPGGEEVRQAIDLLTTNETSFFREPPHFDYLREVIVPGHASAHRIFRLWSAASSSGEEAYTAAMVLAETPPAGSFEIVGTDVSTRIVAGARRGLYPIEAAARIPMPLLRKYWLKGRDEYAGLMAAGSTLRERVSFLHANLLDDLADLGRFDVILLRNVMIYFDQPTKASLIRRLQDMLYPGGHLIVSLSESLNAVPSRLRMVRPSIYRLPSVDGADG
ncbi:CheR family methyltransferase [Dactylosporangium sp. AC04546]|uniref:CheR family methyltransferase n=1 Tax=Dactylosporangium sp. AC04546 TaxID=2862460 RepID=UPI001EDE984A|nr:CheR family methyltransferase [Dactylosporangium sp. AC04546]WVK87847.1 CheR family methyltransferase [Dactylosporangium sp. AC04546]